MEYVLSKPIQRMGRVFDSGQVVYLYTGYDYGLAADDTRTMNEPHICVTLEKDKTPFFTVPLSGIVKATTRGEFDSPVMQHVAADLINRSTNG